MLLIQSALLAGLVAHSAPAPFAFVAQTGAVTEYALPNGLRVVLAPDEGAGRTTVNMTYMAGSRNEVHGDTGVAHLLEHLMFRGTTNVPDAKKALAEQGAWANATTWFDRTSYFEVLDGTDETLRWAIGFEADRMVGTRITEDDVRSEAAVVQREIDTADSFAENVLGDRLMAAAFVRQEYRTPPIGLRADVAHASIERIRGFYLRNYRPDNAMLFIGGRFDRSKVLAWIAEAFGKLPRAVLNLERTETVEPPQDGERAVTVRRSGGAPMVMLGYHVPAATHPDFAAIAVLAEALGGTSGVLAEKLVRARRSTDAGCSVLQSKDPGLLSCQAKLLHQGTAERTMRTFVATMERQPLVTAQEAERAKAAVLRELDATFDDSLRFCMELAEWAAVGDWRMLFLHRDRVAKVTVEDVNRVAARYLKRSNRTMAIYIPTDDPEPTDVPAALVPTAQLDAYASAPRSEPGEAFDASPRGIDQRTQRSDLANGMQLSLLVKQTRSATVRGALALRFGTEQSLRGLRAISDFTAGMIVRGTMRRDRGSFNAAVNAIEMRLNVEPQVGGVLLTFAVPRRRLTQALELIGEALKSPAFDRSEVETLRGELLTGFREAISDPVQLGFGALARAAASAPKGHPAAPPTIDESMSAVAGITPAALNDFHSRFYGAQNSQLALVGDFDAAEVHAQLEGLFAAWRAKEPYAEIPQRHRHTPTQPIAIESGGSRMAFAGWTMPFSMNDSNPDWPAMWIANYMLGGGFRSGRISERLREKEGLAYSATTVLNVPSFGDGASLAGYAICAPQEAQRVEEEMKDELRRAIAHGFTDEELTRAKTGLLRERNQARAIDNRLVRQLVEQRRSGRTMRYEQEFDDRLKALTVADVARALKDHLDPAQMTTIMAGPISIMTATSARRSGR
jgi:zinc protease